MRLKRELAKRSVSLVLCLIFFAIGFTFPSSSVSAANALPAAPAADDFQSVAPQGFGDRHNSWAWSMQWWQGNLYVGTNRSWDCVQRAAFALHFPDLFTYPPEHPELDCADNIFDMSLRAEIWRYTPETRNWERVYQAPNDVEVVGRPGTYVARDLGYRYMTLFKEPDGTEALYVAGVGSEAINPGAPPPRLLRSTDGVTFEPVPQEPGTTFGDLEEYRGTIRTLAVFNKRLYIVVGRLYGNGIVLEAEDPAGGNDNFRRVTPEGMEVFELAPYNGHLYLGLTDTQEGYSVVKTRAQGDPPYNFTTVVPGGAHRTIRPSVSVISMYVFKNRLYVGTDSPAELIRVHPNDHWDLLVGAPRWTPTGWKQPLSGMLDGFDYFMNAHIWRMQEHNGWLFIGTADFSMAQYGAVPPWWDHRFPWMGPIFEPWMGFDLFATRDGVNYETLTRNGFNDRFSFGVRSFASTPYGLFLGTANPYHGLRIWQGVTEITERSHLTYLPWVDTGQRK